MEKDVLFWLVFLIWIICYFIVGYPYSRRDAHLIVIAILLAILGWAQFGAAVK